MGHYLSRTEIDRKMQSPQLQPIEFEVQEPQNDELMRVSFSTPINARIYATFQPPPTSDPNEAYFDMLEGISYDQQTGRQQNWRSLIPFIQEYYPDPIFIQLGDHSSNTEYSLRINPRSDNPHIQPSDLSLSLSYGIPGSYFDEVAKYSPLLEPIDWGSLTAAVGKIRSNPLMGDIRHNSLYSMTAVPHVKGAEYYGSEIAEDFSPEPTDFLSSGVNLIDKDGRPTDVDFAAGVRFKNNAFVPGSTPDAYFFQGYFDKIHRYDSQLSNDREDLQFQYLNNTLEPVNNSSTPDMIPIFIQDDIRERFALTPRIMSISEFNQQIDSYARWSLWVLALRDLNVPITDSFLKRMKRDGKLPSDSPFA